MTSRRISLDALAVAGLVALWLLFFWRLLTPVAADQASLKQGDFSGQFVTFAGYQYARLSTGEVPLWNPYNNGGLPFIADTQAAVFYPPRLATIALSSLSGAGWTYHALELEMMAHVLAFTLLMYAFVRRLTLTSDPRASAFGAFVAAVIAGYSGFTAGYPLLQIALLEAAIWLPLALLGVLEATRDPAHLRWRWLWLAGLALGLSWLAGHPQTSFFSTYLLVAYLAYPLFTQSGPARGQQLRRLIGGAVLLGAVTLGAAAVTLLPGFEYLLHTTRAGFGFDDKANGFPIRDIIQLVVPGIVSTWSPLYVGFVGLALALTALARRLPQALFWGVVALIGLLWSFGENSAFFAAIYNLLPGLRFFRGQERAAFLVMVSLATLAGLGAAALAGRSSAIIRAEVDRWTWLLRRVFALCAIFAALVVVAWLGANDAYEAVVSRVVLAAVVAGLVTLLLPRAARGALMASTLLTALLVFELFTVSMDHSATFDHTPPQTQIAMAPPPLVAQVLADTNGTFRVDGFRGLTANYGSLYGLADIRGISPLFMAGPHRIIEGDLPDSTAWELFAVRYVFSDWQELPVPSAVVGIGSDFYGEIRLHRLSDPRPFALMMTAVEVVSDPEAAFARLADPTFNPREALLLERTPEPSADVRPGSARVVSFAPERIVIETEGTGLLSIALPYYPGWEAHVNGQMTEILRAYGALSAVGVTEDDARVELVYNPLSYRVGALLSLFTWIASGILGAQILVSRSRDAKRTPVSGLDRRA